MAFNSVVFPEPVPPETTMLSRQRAAISRTRATGVVMLPFATIVSRVIRRLENFRIVMQGPSSASGGKTMFTRLPSGSRQSTNGLASSMRRPTAEAIFCARTASCWLSRNRVEVRDILPAISTKTLSGPLIMTSVTRSSCNNPSSGPYPTMSAASS